jgi:hypothetical protein
VNPADLARAIVRAVPTDVDREGLALLFSRVLPVLERS